MKTCLQRIKQSKNLQLILFFGLIIQIIFCITAVGYFHPDQHFQVIEFSSYQLHEANAATAVWELASNIRPTFQVYLFSAFRLCCKAISIDNPFHQLTMLRVLLGITCFMAFNLMAFYYCEKKSERTLIITTLLLNFSWFLPYSKTLFSSEIIAALVFFPSLAFFQQRYMGKQATSYHSILTGFLLAISFFLRFQMGFAIAGFSLWILVFEKQFKLSLYILIGFAVGVIINVFLDYNFYHKLVFTPYLYFKKNIVEGVASSFGEQNFTFYIGVLIGIVGAPLISVVLLYHYLKTSVQRLKHPLVISTLFFILGHFLVAHKEDRFMFTIVGIIPVVLALGSDAYSFFSSNYRWKKIVRPVMIFSVGLNSILLILFVFNPYSQTINFEKVLSDEIASAPTTIYCYQRTPLETESHLPLTFYSKGLKNIDFITIHNIDSITSSASKPIWLSTTFNDAREKLGTINSSGYKPQCYSSSMLWNINLFLLGRNMNTINDIWVLYKLEK